MTERKNEIWIGKNGRGYFLEFATEHYKYHGKPERYSKQYLLEDFFSLAQGIIIRPADFYEEGIKLKFEKNPDFKITPKEKSTIKNLIERLEKDAKEIKDLKYTINKINTLRTFTKKAPITAGTNKRTAFFLFIFFQSTNTIKTYNAENKNIE